LFFVVCVFLFIFYLNYVEVSTFQLYVVSYCNSFCVCYVDWGALDCMDLLQQLYQQALTIKSAIPHPRIMGIIHECGGKMHMAERHWAEAATDFFEAFKNYDEAGNHRRIQCLKCVNCILFIRDSKHYSFFMRKLSM
jgi:hypothetical protein